MAPNHRQPLRRPQIDRELIRELRLERDLSLPAAALLIGCQDKHLGRIERGKRGASELMLRRIAKAYGVKPDEIRRQEEAQPAA